MPKQSEVFISYARAESQAPAQRLASELGALSFLDSAQIEVGASFPQQILDALLNSRIVVVFLGPAYLMNWCCQLELRAALAPFQASASTEDLAHVVVVLPNAEVGRCLSHLPPTLQAVNWPAASATSEIVKLVRQRLAAAGPALSALFRTSDELQTFQTRFRETAAIPRARPLIGYRGHIARMPESLQDAFCGRAGDLWTLHYNLCGPPESASQYVLLHSLAGFGKTRLATEYVYRLARDHFPGGTFWIEGGVDSLSLDRQWHTILRSIDAAAPDFEQFCRNPTARDEAISRLDCETSGRFLLVVDGVPESGDLSPGLMPQFKNGSVLLTCRRRLVSQIPLTLQELGPLSKPAAAIVLSEKVPITAGSAEDWDFIADSVGHHPLTLTLLNRVLIAGESGADLKQTIRQSKSRTRTINFYSKELSRAWLGTPLPDPSELWMAAYDQLSQEARELLSMFALFGDSALPSSLVSNLAHSAYALVPHESPTVSADRLRQARSALTHRGFVNLTGGSRYVCSVHQLVADFVRSLPHDDPDRYVLLSYVALLKTLDSAESCDGSGVLDLLPQAEALFQANQEVIQRARGPVRFDGRSHEFPYALLTMAYLLGIRIAGLYLHYRHLSDAMRVLRVCDVLADGGHLLRQLNAFADPGTAVTEHLLAKRWIVTVLALEGNFQAALEQMRHYRSSFPPLPQKHPVLASALVDLGVLYCSELPSEDGAIPVSQSTVFTRVSEVLTLAASKLSSTVS